MPRPSDPALPLREPPFAGFALLAALVATVLALVLAAVAVAQLRPPAPTAVEVWLLALAVLCSAIAVAWSLWRSRELTAARWLGVAREVGAEQPGQQDQALLETLRDALPLPMFELAGDAGAPDRVFRANPAAADWLGARPAELIDLGLPQLFERLPQALRDAARQALDAPAGSAPPAGAPVLLRRIAGAQPQRWLMLLTPPGATARADERAAAQDAFGYTVSHDLRAPLRVVEGFTKIVKEDYGRQLDRIGNDHLDRVLGAAARMNSMIDALLALAQLSIRPLARQPVNLSQLAGYVVDDLRRQTPERRVEVRIEAGMLVQGDPTLLRIALENLLGNAWKYSARAATARISFERSRRDGQDVYTVRDNGAGFDMRFADRLFGVFQRLHSASDFPGTGVGLASVRRIVERHGGTIWAESAPDQGASFHFTLAPRSALAD